MSSASPSPSTGADAVPASGLRVLRAPQVFGARGKTGLSRSMGYRLIAAGQFPCGFLLSPQARGWLESDVDAWIAKRAAGAVVPVQATPATPGKRGPGRPRKHPEASS